MALAHMRRIGSPWDGRPAHQRICVALLEAIGDAAAVQVIHGKLHRDLVPGQDLDVVHAHLA